MCNAGWIGDDCSQPDREINLGNVIITQHALNDGVGRFIPQINEAFNSVKSNLSIEAFEKFDCLYYLARLPRLNSTQFNIVLLNESIQLLVADFGIQVIAKFAFDIPSVPLDVYISTFPGTYSCCFNNGLPKYVDTSACSAAW